MLFFRVLAQKSHFVEIYYWRTNGWTDGTPLINKSQNLFKGKKPLTPCRFFPRMRNLPDWRLSSFSVFCLLRFLQIRFRITPSASSSPSVDSSVRPSIIHYELIQILGELISANFGVDGDTKISRWPEVLAERVWCLNTVSSVFSLPRFFCPRGTCSVRRWRAKNWRCFRNNCRFPFRDILWREKSGSPPDKTLKWRRKEKGGEHKGMGWDGGKEGDEDQGKKKIWRSLYDIGSRWRKEITSNGHDLMIRNSFQTTRTTKTSTTTTTTTTVASLDRLCVWHFIDTISDCRCDIFPFCQNKSYLIFVPSSLTIHFPLPFLLWLFLRFLYL